MKDPIWSHGLLFTGRKTVNLALNYRGCLDYNFDSHLFVSILETCCLIVDGLVNNAVVIL